jgi:hypothetical protein
LYQDLLLVSRHEWFLFGHQPRCVAFTTAAKPHLPVKELNIFNLNIIIQNNNWNHHVERMKPEHIPKQLMDYTPRGTRTTGCLKLCWKDESIVQRNGTDHKIQILMFMLWWRLTRYVALGDDVDKHSEVMTEAKTFWETAKTPNSVHSAKIVTGCRKISRDGGHGWMATYIWLGVF